MTEEQKLSIIESGKQYFREIIIPNHVKGLEELKLKDFNIDPFLVNYLAAFLCGDTETLSFAKALIYPRILDTSINTNFNQNIQIFISSLAQIAGYASGIDGIDGIDVVFIDALDGRRKYCQCKTGPQTTNMDDVATVYGHFTHLMNKARLDRLDIEINDMIVGVLFGNLDELSSNYKNIDKTFPVYCGAEFWDHFTGDSLFYHRMLKAFDDVVEENNTEGKHLALEIIRSLSDEIVSFYSKWYF